MFAFAMKRAASPNSPLVKPEQVWRLDGADSVEAVKLKWGLRPKEPGGEPWTVVRSEGREFPSHRCLIPSSEFYHMHKGRRYRFTLASGDYFYFAGIWRPATEDWPEAYAILTISPNADVAPYHGRQMAVLKRGRHIDWLTMAEPDAVLLRPLPPKTFAVEEVFGQEAEHGQSMLAF